MNYAFFYSRILTPERIRNNLYSDRRIGVVYFNVVTKNAVRRSGAYRSCRESRKADVGTGSRRRVRDTAQVSGGDFRGPPHGEDRSQYEGAAWRISFRSVPGAYL